MRRNPTSRGRGSEGFWWCWACAPLPPVPTGATLKAAAVKQRFEVQRLAVERARERLPQPAVEVTKKRLPFGVGSGELPESRWRQLGAAARCLEARQPFFVAGRPKPAARLSRARPAVRLRRLPFPGLRLEPTRTLPLAQRLGALICRLDAEQVVMSLFSPPLAFPLRADVTAGEPQFSIRQISFC